MKELLELVVTFITVIALTGAAVTVLTFLAALGWSLGELLTFGGM